MPVNFVDHFWFTNEFQVFRCINASCGRYYHPHCVAKLLHRENQLNVDNHQKKIAAGEPFACPMHQCFVCNQIEDKNNKELQFAICRRCPRSYHRKCLPRSSLNLLSPCLL